MARLQRLASGVLFIVVPGKLIKPLFQSSWNIYCISSALIRGTTEWHVDVAPQSLMGRCIFSESGCVTGEWVLAAMIVSRLQHRTGQLRRSLKWTFGNCWLEHDYFASQVTCLLLPNHSIKTLKGKKHTYLKLLKQRSKFQVNVHRFPRSCETSFTDSSEAGWNIY